MSQPAKKRKPVSAEQAKAISVLEWARANDPALAERLDRLVKRVDRAGDWEEKIRKFVPGFTNVDDEYSMQLLDAFAHKHLGCSANDILNAHVSDTSVHAELDTIEADRQHQARLIAAAMQPVPDSTAPTPKLTAEEIIQGYRMKKGITLLALAGDAGIDERTLRRMRHGKHLSGDSYHKVAMLVGCKPEDLTP